MVDNGCTGGMHFDDSAPSTKLFKSFLKFKKIKLSRMMDKTSKSDGVVVMMMLKHAGVYGEGPGIKTQELLRMTHVSKPSMSRTVKHLEKQGLIVRREDSVDRRNTNLYLTEEGKKIGEEYVNKMMKISDTVCERLGTEKLELLVQYLNELTDYLEEEIDKAYGKKE